MLIIMLIAKFIWPGVRHCNALSPSVILTSGMGPYSLFFWKEYYFVRLKGSKLVSGWCDLGVEYML